MRPYTPLLVLGLLLGIHANLFAANSDSPVPEMRVMVANGQYSQAYELGTRNLDEWEGSSPEFDFFYGLSALESGEPNEAVFALERATATAANGVLRERSRLELARAYFVTNNLTAAESLFLAVLENEPPQNVQQNIQAFLQLIDARRTSQQPSFSWSIASAIGSDGNINSATSNGLIDTPLVGQIELNPDGRETEDDYSTTTLGMNYIYPFTRDRALTANLSLNHLDNFSTNQFDIDSLRGALSYGWGSDTNRFRHGLSAANVQLDGEGFQDSTGINSSWQRNYGGGWYHNLSAGYNLIRYDDSDGSQNSLRDVDQTLLTAGVTRLQGQLTHTVSLYGADESPENDERGAHNGRQFYGLAYSLLYRLTPRHTPYLRASWQDVEHDSRHPVFFNTVRADETQNLTGGWLWQLHNSFSLTTEVAYTDNTSNIPLFDYTRFKYQAGLRIQF